jgi:hypothetical protein
MTVAAAVLLAGCDNPSYTRAQVQIPKPINMLLPQQVRIHSFTGSRVFGAEGGVTGIDVRVEALDGFGDATKAFGRFRFELFHYQADSANPKGLRIAVWNSEKDLDLTDVERNRQHWNSIFRTYQFKLGWTENIPIGKKFVLVTTFESPFTERLTDERVFVSGQ